MKCNPELKALTVTIFAIFLISTATAVTSEFTNTLPDTQQINQDFTISGEVNKEYSWEQDFESILIQYSPEGSSTWFVEKEKDVGCYGSSCSISSDTVSYDTAENVEYRIVALNNAGTTVPYNPNTESVDFVEEEEPVAELLSVGASDYSVSENDGSTTLKADVKNNRGSSSYVHIIWKADGQEIEDTYSYVSANSEETVSVDVSYSDLSNQLDTDTEYELKAELDYRDVNVEKTALESLVVESIGEEERWVRFQNLPDNYRQGQSHTVEAKAYDSEAGLYNRELKIQYRKDGGWEKIRDRFCFPRGTTHECSTSGSFTPTSSGEYNLRAEIITQDGETLSTETTVNVDETETTPVAELERVFASDYSVSESDRSTTLKADVKNNRDSSSYVHVTWKADGEVIEDKYSFVSSNSEETVTKQVYYSDLSNQFNTDTEYELSAVLDYRDVNEEKTASNNLVIESADTDPVAELNSVSTSNYRITESEGSTRLKADVKNNRGSSSYVHIRWKVNGDVIEDKYSLISANSEERVSKQITYSELEDEGLNPGTEYTLRGNLQYRDVDVTKSASNKLYLVPETTERRLEISNVRSTDTNINEGEATQFKADLSANEDIGYLDIKFFVNNERITTKQVTNLDEGETRTVISTTRWSDLESRFDTGTNHDLKVKASNYRIDESRTRNNAFYLNEGSERPSCQEFDDADLNIDLESFESIPEEGNTYDSSVRLYNDGNRDLGGNLGLYIKESNQVMNCDYYNNYYSDLIGFTGSNVYPHSGDSDAFDFSYSGTPLDNLEYGETYSLVAVFNSDSTTYVGPAGAIQWSESEEQDRNPTARFSWDKHPGKTGESIRFDGSGSTDPDGDIEKYRWSFDDGSGYRYGETRSYSFGSTGTYDVTLRVKDSKGNTDTRTREVEVVRDPGDCSVNVGRLRLGNSVIDEGDSTTASVEVTNNGQNQDVRVRFKVGGNTVKTVNREVSSNSQSTFQASVSPNRDRIITAEVTTQGSPCGDRNYERYRELAVVEGGDNGGDDPDKKPEASFRWSPSQPAPEETVAFDGSDSYDEDGDIVEYKWFFGDGSNPGYGRNVQHNYGSTGDYDVQLVVEDSEGDTDSITRTVPVVQEPGACSLGVGQIRFGESIITRGESTTGSITVSNLGDRQAVQIRFREGSEVVDSRETVIEADSQRTFSTSLNPQIDKIIKAEVTTRESPCGSRSFNRHKELVVVEGGDQSSTLEVNVDSEDGRNLQNARVSVQSSGTGTTRYTGSQGRTYFELDSGNYDVAVSRSGYRTEVRNVNLNSASHRTITVTLGRRDSGQGTFTALVQDGEGNRLRNAEITVENGVTKYRDTDSNGRATLNLDAGMYSVTARKTGYGSWTESVNIDRGEDTTRVFRLTGDTTQGLRIADVDYSNTVCRGSTLRTDVTIENNEEYHEFVSLTGKGLGSINAASRFSLDEGETVTKTVHFTNVQGSGTEEFTITVNNDDSDSSTRTVDVESCGTTARGEASDISMQLGYTRQQNMAVTGDILKVEGFVDGANGRSTVDIGIDGETKASVRTQPDGYYRTWITADEVGSKTVTASTEDVSASSPLRVIPTSRVTNLEAPVSIFEGQTYSICARVQSQIEPEVILERNGEVITSKVANGRVCFEQQARDPGMHVYRIAALTSGEGNSVSSTVEVLEQDVEASSFPDQIASVESGSGMVRVDLYNTNDNQTRYSLNLEGLPSTWTSQSEKQVILDKGERRTVYFYLTPQNEGSYEPTISVTSRGSEVFREKLDVITGGTTESMPRDRSFFGDLAEGLTGLFAF